MTKTKTETLGIKTETKTKTLGLKTKTKTKTFKIQYRDQDSSLENSKSAIKFNWIKCQSKKLLQK